MAVVAAMLAACLSVAEAVADDPEPASMGEIEYSDQAYLELVRKYADEDGKVDYQAWKDNAADMARLDEQLALLAAVSPETNPEQFAGRAVERSYWINAYNMLVLDAVLEHWPLESVMDVKISFSSRVVPGKGFFYDQKVVVGGRETNLRDLEKEVLKKQKDPRLHFAFNCASSSCPVLRPWEWTDAQLDQAARDFVNNPANVAVEDGKVYLSRIFKWYRKDFPDDQLAYIGQYAEPALREALLEAGDQNYKVEYVEYDWKLNGVESAGGDEG